jgi:hypothetical protein
MRKLPALWIALLSLSAAEHRGTVTFGGLPVPGAAVTATRGAARLTTVTGEDGAYAFPDLDGSPWQLRVDMQLFLPQTREITPGAASVEWQLEPAPVDARTQAAPPPPPAAKPEPPKPQPAKPTDPDLAQRAADGLVINGSVNNALSSPFAQLPAFGNNRRGPASLYNASLGLILNHNALDARAFSVTGQNTPKPDYTRAQGLFAFGGPITRRRGPQLTVNYQWTRNTNATVQSALVPTPAERAGDFSAAPVKPVDPATGQPFPDARIPASRLSPQAQALLDLFPPPNFAGSSRYNFQTPIVTGLHQDDLQTRLNKQRRKNFYSGHFNLQSTRTSNPSVYGLLDTSRALGLNTGAQYRRSFHPRLFLTLGVQFSRQREELTPFFANRRNVSADAGIAGNNQEAANWGPPALNFASGVTNLTSPQYNLTRNQTAAYTADGFYNRGSHNLTFGAAHRRQQFNVLSQQDARGAFAFTGAAAANDVAGFLLGIPDASSIAYGNADKYLRATIHEAFLNDDWRVHPGLTINYGLRYDYWSPVEEKYGRLVNIGAPARLNPDRNNWSPRLGFSWRPLPANSLLLRGGYGLYYDTSIYQPIALRMAQQAPLSRSIRVDNTPQTPLTLAAGFPPAASSPVFAADPNLRVGYAQTWQLSLQKDLPAALQMIATYSGSKGTRALQQILPFTTPDGALPGGGYSYLLSNGNSTRHAGRLQLRRRLRRGLAAELSYTWAKAIDNATPGGRNPYTAQNWLDLRAERARSDFDQRHLLAASAQYSTASKHRALREWTFSTQINAGSGLPLTPVYPLALRGTGVTGSLRPDFTGADLYAPPPGLYLNPAAVAKPQPGRWGNAGRNSITGPNQFALNASLGRTFRSNDRFSYDVRLDAANALNSVRFPSWNTTLGNAQFGLPVTANPMRTIQATIRTRF